MADLGSEGFHGVVRMVRFGQQIDLNQGFLTLLSPIQLGGDKVMKKFAGGAPLQMAKGTKISLNGEIDEIYFLSGLGCELVREEYLDIKDWEVLPAILDRMTSEQINCALARGQMKLLSLPYLGG